MTGSRRGKGVASGDIGKVDKNEICGTTGYSKELGFYFKCNKKSLKAFSQDMIWSFFMFYKFTMPAIRKMH